MNITVIGTGYVGLVTGVCLSNVSNKVVCLDIDENKIKLLNLSVCGIIVIWKPYFKIFAIVRETPLIAIDPFGIRYFLNLLESLKFINQDFPMM